MLNLQEKVLFARAKVKKFGFSSVKITVKFIQIYNYTFATYHAPINLKVGLIQTPPKSQFMQSIHKMLPKCIF